MKKLIHILILILIISCTTKPSVSPEIFAEYKLKFSRPGNLERMEKGLFGMGYTTDGEYLYAVNGAVIDLLLRGGIPKYSVNIYGDVSGGGGAQSVTSSISSKTIYRYSPEEDKWSIIPDKLKAKRFSCAEYIDGEIYVFNGFDYIFYNDRMNRVVNKNFEVIDTNSGEVSHLSKNPYPAYYSGTAVWDNNIYVFGGAFTKSQYSNKLLMYNTYRDEWSQLRNMSEQKTCRGEIVNGILYVFGGYNGRVSSKIHSYDIENDTWTYITNMPFGISANAITKHGDFIWLIGDYYRLSTVAVFNTKTNEFHLIKSSMSGRRHAGAEIIENKLYVFGGNRQSTGSFLSSIQVADITEIEKLISQE